MSTKLLDLVNITKSYDGVTILDDLNLYIRENEFLTLLGPSGCGKTTTLRILGGFETPDAGKVLFNGQDITQLPPNKRQLNTVFQKYALFTHMTIAENIAFGLKIKRKSKAYIDDKIKYALKLVNLEGYENRSPALLSGGQQQRIAIARAIVNEPKVLLLDEPLGALDLKLRQDMQYELIRLKNELGITFVYVTHDQMEAMTLATQICLINNGVLQQYQPPLTVYNHPQNLFVADFVGNPSINFVEAKGAQQPDGSITLDILGGIQAVFRPREGLDLAAWFAERDRKAAAHAAERLAKSQEKGYVEKGNKDEPFRYHIAKVEEEDDSLQEEPVLTNEDLVLGIRPEFLNITSEAPLKGEIYGAMPTGMESTIKVYVNGFLLTGVVFGSSLFTIGEQHSISFTGHHIMLFDRQSGDCIALGSLETL